MANDRKTQFGWAPPPPNAPQQNFDTAPTGRYTPSHGTPALYTPPQPAPSGYGSDAQYMATYGTPAPMPNAMPSVDAHYAAQQAHAQAAALAQAQQAAIDSQHAQAAALYGPDYANAAYPTATAAMAAAHAKAYPPSNAYVSYPSAAPYVTPAPASTAVPSSAPAPAKRADTQRELTKSESATAGVSDRVRFIRLTYLHLLFAILVFTGLEYVVQTTPVLVDKLVNPFTTWALTGRNWGLVLLAFMGVSWVADYYASHAKSRAAQYFGLLLYVCAEVAIFVPLLAIVSFYTQDILASGGADPHILRDAGFTTVGVFLVLTLSVLVSKKDFSFLRGGLAAASGAALALIAMSILWGFSLGLAFSVAMVFVASGYILFNTSQVLAHYDTRQHVAAALALFSSLALLFWYVIRIFLRMRSN